MLARYFTHQSVHVLEWKWAVLEFLRWCAGLVWHIFKANFYYVLFSPSALTSSPNSQVSCNSTVIRFGNESMDIWRVHYSYSQSLLEKYLEYVLSMVQNSWGTGRSTQENSLPFLVSPATQPHYSVPWFFLNVNYDMAIFHTSSQRALIFLE